MRSVPWASTPAAGDEESEGCRVAGGQRWQPGGAFGRTVGLPCPLAVQEQRVSPRRENRMPAALLPFAPSELGPRPIVLEDVEHLPDGTTISEDHPDLAAPLELELA